MIRPHISPAGGMGKHPWHPLSLRHPERASPMSSRCACASRSPETRIKQGPQAAHPAVSVGGHRLLQEQRSG